jgi:hypothetical protein
LTEVDLLRGVGTAAWPARWIDAELAKKGRFYECSQSLVRFVRRLVRDLGVPRDAQDETTNRRVSIAKDVPGLRIDYRSTQSPLPGMRRG